MVGRECSLHSRKIQHIRTMAGIMSTASNHGALFADLQGRKGRRELGVGAKDAFRSLLDKLDTRTSSLQLVYRAKMSWQGEQLEVPTPYRTSLRLHLERSSQPFNLRPPPAQELTESSLHHA